MDDLNARHHRLLSMKQETVSGDEELYSKHSKISGRRPSGEPDERSKPT